MILAGLDIATTTGLALIDGDKITASTWTAPKRNALAAEGQKKKIDPRHSGVIGAAFSQHLRSWLVENHVEYVAVEEPLRSDARHSETTVDYTAQWAGKAIRKESKPATNMATLYRLYGLSFLALTICASLGIPAIMVNQAEWRKAFLRNGTGKGAKAAAVAQCQTMRITYSSVDACEAVGVAWWLQGHLFPQKFAAADSLFNLPPSRVGSSATASV